MSTSSTRRSPCGRRATPGPLVAGVDLVLDGTDDFATRFAVNAACVKPSGPWSRRHRPLDRPGRGVPRPALLPLPGARDPPDAETCVAVGVVGALAGVIGSMMALETIKLIAGAGEPWPGACSIYDGLAGETPTVRIGADPEVEVCEALARPAPSTGRPPTSRPSAAPPCPPPWPASRKVSRSTDFPAPFSAEAIIFDWSTETTLSSRPWISRTGWMSRARRRGEMETSFVVPAPHVY